MKFSRPHSLSRSVRRTQTCFDFPARTQRFCVLKERKPGGDGEIRTHGRVAPSAVFKFTVELNRIKNLADFRLRNLQHTYVGACPVGCDSGPQLRRAFPGLFGQVRKRGAGIRRPGLSHRRWPHVVDSAAGRGRDCVARKHAARSALLAGRIGATALSQDESLQSVRSGCSEAGTEPTSSSSWSGGKNLNAGRTLVSKA